MSRFFRSTLLLAITVCAVAGSSALAAGAATPEGCRALRLHGKSSEAIACFEALSRSGDPYFNGRGLLGTRGLSESKGGV